MNKDKNIVIYQSGELEIKVSVDKDTIWLSAENIAKLFDVQRPAIVKHIGNIYKTNELSKCLTCSILEQVAKDDNLFISDWLRNRNTLEYLGIWEKLNNPDFNPIEFEGFRKQAGLNSFVLTSKQWVEKTNAIGLISKAGRYGGTYGHKNITFIKVLDKIKEEDLT